MKLPPPLEKVVQRDILAYLGIMGIFAWRNNTMGTYRPDKGRFIPTAGMRGVSDIIGCYRGRFLAIEIKRLGGKATHEQEQFLKTIRCNGGIAILAYSVDDVKRGLEAEEKP